jgi:hypothetical protein
VNAGERSIFQNNSTKSIRIDDQNRSVETRRSTKLQISNRVICQSELHEYFLCIQHRGENEESRRLPRSYAVQKKVVNEEKKPSPTMKRREYRTL